MFAALIRTSLTLSVATLATAGIVAFSAAPASAATVKTAIVDARGLDLNSAAGRTAAEFQVRIAAARVCSAGDGRSLAEARAVRACIATAIAAAQPRLQRLAANQAATRLAAVTATPASAL